MTTEGYREVDDDLLADYLGGALDGTPQQAEVARLVDTDPVWAGAYALLAHAVTEVRADLARWAEPAPELPPAVADRLTAALAAADPARNGTSADADTADVEPEADVTTPVVPAQGGSGRRPAGPSPAESARGPRTGPGRGRRRWSRRAAPVAVAAVAVVAVGLGLTQLSTNSSDTAGTSALNQPASAPESAAAAGAVRTTGPALHSGTNYTPQTLGNPTGVPSPLRGGGSSVFSGQPGMDAEKDQRTAATSGGLSPLARLTDEAALTTCLADVAAEHGSAPLVVDVIDYAGFRGEPALVIRFTDAAGARWAWVSGPECGVPGSGSDSRYSARVG
ncbi:hypothetical protein EAD89_13100 [Micromonospora sp. BL4]|uniref:hypothetical protein n=1 Tax=Micromonospora sp. BL4 TaxID=2478710 RepID=UPI000EF5ECEC|nr:hypothetical protein [Micromonospora sp. BL4]RLP90555.1 hypothetical protein EAD89_13100 [Micromonospora sp. BL4]